MASTQKSPQLALLDPEPWGRMFKRAREDHAGLKLLEVVEKVARYHLVDASTINRLEKLSDAPRVPRQRALAFLCCLVYGLDPAQFGLDGEDVPPGIREQVVASTIWKNVAALRPTLDRAAA